ncbi:hypothetical protein [Spirosoma migulaei]
MKTTTQLIMNALLLSLLLVAPALNAQPATNEPEDSLSKQSSFEVGMFMESNWTINLMLAVHQPKRVLVTLKNDKGALLFRDYLKKIPANYRLKFRFSESDSGVYQFEISDDQQTIVRRVEVVYMPAVKSQRYITYGPQINF